MTSGLCYLRTKRARKIFTVITICLCFVRRFVRFVQSNIILPWQSRRYPALNCADDVDRLWLQEKKKKTHGQQRSGVLIPLRACLYVAD